MAETIELTAPPRKAHSRAEEPSIASDEETPLDVSVLVPVLDEECDGFPPWPSACWRTWTLFMSGRNSCSSTTARPTALPMPFAANTSAIPGCGSSGCAGTSARRPPFRPAWITRGAGFSSQWTVNLAGRSRRDSAPVAGARRRPLSNLVSGWKRTRRDPWRRRLASRVFNWVTRTLSNVRPARLQLRLQGLPPGSPGAGRRVRRTPSLHSRARQPARLSRRRDSGGAPSAPRRPQAGTDGTAPTRDPWT